MSKLTAAALALIMVAVLGLNVANALIVRDFAGCLVIDKDRTTRADDGTSDMRIYTENCGTLRVGDDLLSWQFDAADTYAGIEPGQTYTFTARGYRIGLLSLFPKVIEVQP